MNELLDTNAFLWYALGDPKLSKAAKDAIEDRNNRIWVSPASYWEIAIKMSVGKYSLTVPHGVFFDAAIADNGFQILHILPRHSNELVGLPFHHRDPFDRLIIAQAIVEDFEIVSSDTAFDAYSIRRIW